MICRGVATFLFGLIIYIPKMYAGAFFLEGHIKGINKGWLYLNYLPGNDQRGRLDSALVSDGYFQFTGKITEPCLAVLSTFNLFGPGYKYDEGNIVNFYLEKGKMSVYLEFSKFAKIRIEGSATESEHLELERLKEPFEEKMHAPAELLSIKRNAWLRQKDSLRIKTPPREVDSLQLIVDDLQRMELKIDSLFIVQHPHSFLAADILSNNSQAAIAFPSLSALYERFPHWIRQSRPGKKIYEELQKEKVVYPGADACLFNALTDRGDTFRLGNYRGHKYVLFDFWASWCAPCRGITPMLKKVYQQFSDSLEIVSIAFNDKEDDWRKAIAEDKMDWLQINGDSKEYILNPAMETISRMYRINLIPSLILFDKNLKIISKYNGWYNSKPAYELAQDLDALFKH
jgi:thiol-disulfide isomerase/thioredoxin